MTSKLAFVLACATIATFGGLSAAAVNIEDVILEATATAAGADGDNLSICVLDFGEDAYAFGYRWDDAATGAEMLLDLDAQTPLAVAYTTYSFGIGIDSLSYAGQTIVSDGWVTMFPGYWLSDDGETWDDSGVGVSDRHLSNGSFDGWSQEYVANGYTPIYAPTTPVPEPASLTLLAVGAVAMIRRRRRA